MRCPVCQKSSAIECFYRRFDNDQSGHFGLKCGDCEKFLTWIKKEKAKEEYNNIYERIKNMGFFDDAEEVESNFEALPEGEYVCRLDNMTLDLAGKYGDSFQLELVVAAGDHKKRKLWRNWYFEGQYGPQNKGYLKKTMSDCGLSTDFDSYEQLVDTWDELRGKLLNVYVKVKEKQDGGYKNVCYVNGVFNGSVTDSGLPNHAPAPAPPQGMDTSEELPF